MTFSQIRNRASLLAVAVVAMALSAGCAEPLEWVWVPRDALSDLTNDASSDVSGDQRSMKDVMDAGDELVLPDVPTVEVGEDGDVVSISDGDVADGRDVPPDLTDVANEVVVDASTDADGSAPCPIPGQATCSGRCTSIATDPSNCGACDRPCMIPNGTAGCVAGACTVAACNPGFGDCDGIPANGCEVNLATTALHCGVCNNACTAPTPLCSASTCSDGCTGPGETRCGMACVNLQLDNGNCGRCGNACMAVPNSVVTCASGTCRIICNAGFHDCSGVCASNTAVTSCGDACAPCPTRPNATATCTAGGCGFTCATGFADCDGVAANGCEVNLQTDAANCGRCAGLCHRGDACSMGSCAAVIQVGSGGHVGVASSTTAPSFELGHSAPAGDVNNGMVAAATYLTMDGSGRPIWGIDRGWLNLTVPAGRVVSARVRFYPPYPNAVAREATMSLQGVTFRPAGAVVNMSDYALARWGAEGLFTEAAPFSLFVSGAEVTRTLTAGGIAYLQEFAGRAVRFGLRTNFDLEARPPSTNYSGVEVGDAPPHAEFTILYQL